MTSMTAIPATFRAFVAAVARDDASDGAAARTDAVTATGAAR